MLSNVSTAIAGPGPTAKGAIVSVSTTGGAVVAGLALGGAGMALGGSACGPGPECWSPIIGGIAGGSIGVVGGSIGGALLSAKLLQVHQRPFGRNLAITTGLSLAFAGLALAEPVFLPIGGATMLLGVPIVAGMTATKNAKMSTSSTAARLQFTPVVRHRQHGLVATLVF